MANGKPAGFSPAELDRIEDALETLEDGELPTDLGAPMRERLDDYQQILQMSREALPMQDVPPGALDSVLAEARTAAAEPASAPPKIDTAERSGVWTRFRRAFLIPTLALAGSAAAVLWMVRPEHKDEAHVAAAEPLASPAVAEKSTRSLEQAFPGARQNDGRLRRLADGAVLEEAAEAEEVPNAARPARGAGVAADENKLGEADNAAPWGGGPAKKSKGKKRGTKGDVQDPLDDFKPEPEPKKPAAKTPAPPPASVPAKPAPSTDKEASEMATQIDRGDRYRRSGNCKLARVAYKRALGAASSLSRASAAQADRSRARAHAGLGLCDEMDGNVAAARSRFTKARKAWAGIDAFIRAEQGRSYGGGASTKKSKAKPKQAKPNAAEQTADEGL